MNYLPPSVIFTAGFPALLASVLRRGLSLSRGGSWQAREYSRTCTDIQRLACNILCLKTLLLPSYFTSVVLFTPLIDFWCLPMFEDILFSSPSTTPINPLFSSCLFGLVSSGRVLSRGTVEGLAEMMYWIGQRCASWRMLQRAAKRSLAETSHLETSAM
ncbi:hypothetical protein BGZ57DRAFT_339957 [Hyaloscypha finlandica]|nr:hypothetical protein F5882DRAFT_44388 [Hyaloscypha sp. PMI_1271]KAH8778948.1 hypothetical protein BGZ57DRAFT_339957 [Hyaloscypha finlandica]